MRTIARYAIFAFIGIVSAASTGFDLAKWEPYAVLFVGNLLVWLRSWADSEAPHV